MTFKKSNVFEMICEMDGVSGGDPEFPVELWRDDKGELFIVAYNEGGFNSVQIPLNEVKRWLADHPQEPFTHQLPLGCS